MNLLCLCQLFFEFLCDIIPILFLFMFGPSHPPCSSVYTASLGPDYQPPSHQLSFPERPSQPCLLLVGSRGLDSIRHWMLSEFVPRSVSAFGELSQHSAVHHGGLPVSFSTPAVDLVPVPVLFRFPFLALEGREPTMLCRSCSIRGCSWSPGGAAQPL